MRGAYLARREATIVEETLCIQHAALENHLVECRKL